MPFTANDVHSAVLKLANSERAYLLQRFFKTGPGEYGEGDVFLGLTVPMSRTIVKQFRELSHTELDTLIKSAFHEERLIALLILVDQFHRGDTEKRQSIVDFYLKHTKWINNWDLVDTSAGTILGEYLFTKPTDILFQFSISPNLWERRIAIISTFYFIKKGKSELTLQIAEKLLNDKHDLIHKAVGWMLREVGKNCSEKVLEQFLDKYAAKMPRTMLRYSIERLPVQKKKRYMKKTVTIS